MSRRIQSVAPLLALLLAGCSFDEREGFVEVSASYATAPGERVEVRIGRYAYVALEANQGPDGLDLNGDGDALDRVAVLGQLGERSDEVVPVSPRQFRINDNEDLYLAVEEADEGFDWSGDGSADDRVLLHWTRDTGVQPRLAFVDLLRPGLGEFDFEVVRSRVYYASPEASATVDGTNLKYCEQDKPREPVEVLNQAGAGPLDLSLFGEETELLLLLADETSLALDHNGDGDQSDACVLQLLDATESNRRVETTGSALNSVAPVARARRELSGALDWRVAFLVSEGDQGETNLNDPALFDPAWEPAACVGMPDMDNDDDVLHTVLFRAIAEEDAAPINTGLAGRDRVSIVEDGVATLVDESDMQCDLNGDLDQDDTVVRYTSTNLPILPNALTSDTHALAPIPGDSLGLNALDEVFLVVVDEAADKRDHDGDGLMTRQLLAWVDPEFGGAWTFLQRDPDGEQFFVGVGWMNDEQESGRVGLTFLEEAQGLSLNNACSLELKDTDTDDALPAWPRYDGNQLLVPGVGFAVPPSDPGLALFSNLAFFRASESLDNFDHNFDGDKDDLVLVRNPLSACMPEVMDTASMELPEVVGLGGFTGAAFVADELGAGVDYNEDGDTNDLVVRHFQF